MKFVRFDGGLTGLVTAGSDPAILDVAGSSEAFERADAANAALLKSLLPGDGSGSWTGLIENWKAAKPALEALLAFANTPNAQLVIKPLDAVRLLPPVPSAGSVIMAIGGNNAVHMANGMTAITGTQVKPEIFANEKVEGNPPWGFVVLPTTLVGHDEDVAPPKDTQFFDYEAEVAVVLAAGGRDIGTDQIKIWGYTAWNDLSIRDVRFGIGPAMNRGGLSWGLEKNFDKGNAFGPWLVVDEPVDLENLRCRLRVNGEIRQDFSTSEFIWTFADAITHISHYAQLRAGDVIVSGTGPGVAAEAGRDGERWLRPGDLIEYELEGVGILRNRVIDWTK